MWMDKSVRKEEISPTPPLATSTLSHDVPSTGSSMSSSSSSSETALRSKSRLEPSTTSKIFNKDSSLKLQLNGEATEAIMDEDSLQLFNHVKATLIKKDEQINALKTKSERLRTDEKILIEQNLKATIENYEQQISERDTQIIGMAGQLNQAENQITALQDELKLFKHPAQAVKTVDSLAVTDGYHAHSMSGSLSAASLPSDISSGSLTAQDAENKKLKQQIKQLEGVITKLKDMNIQWQSYNDQREAFVKSLQIGNEKSKQEIRSLNEKINELKANPRASGVLEFTPAQQEYLDGVYQKLRSEADKHKEEAEIAAIEGRRNLAAERKLREEAERTIQELTTKVSEQNEKINDLFTQTEELKSALVVATRTNEYPTQAEQEGTINSLREAARQYELDYAKLQDEFAEAKREISQLRNRRQGMSSSHVSPRNVMSQSVSESWYEDIETDIAPVRNFGNLHSMPAGQTNLNPIHNHRPSM